MNDNSFSNMKVYFKECSFYYKTFLIKIDISSLFSLNYSKPSLPFLYSVEQTIEIEDYKDIYDIIFKMGEYNGELLYLFSNNITIPLIKCSKNENETELICKIEKEDIEELLQYSGQEFYVYSYHDYFGIYRMKLIEKIIIIDNRLQKHDIYVEIKKLLQKHINESGCVAYETNITNISNVISGTFYITRNNPDNKICYFKKSVKDPLLLLCKWEYN